MLAAAAVAALLLRARVRAAAPPRPAPTTRAGDRAALFAAGLALVTLPLVSPLDAAGDDYLLSAHMLEHVLIGDAGPALLLVAVRGPLLAFMLPAAVVRVRRPHRRAARRLLGSLGPAGRGGRASGRPRSALWHVPAAYDAALAPPVAARSRARELRRGRAARLDAAGRPGRHAAGSRSAAAPRSPASSSCSARLLCRRAASSARPRSTPPTPRSRRGCSGSRRSPTSSTPAS